MVRKPSFDCNGMKKGAWSEDEDNKLRAYIMRYGHWNWRLLPKYAGLARCGKSCRLRWENYLKPGIKRGNFSKHEQDLIVELHNKLGNKWSAIAAKLPGRSDNEIKNFWHSRIEKRRKAINPTKQAHNAQLLDREKPSQFTFCNTTDQDESISFDCLIEFEDSKLSFDTAKSSETVEKTLVDFNNYDYIWRDIFLENDTAFYSQITCLPPLQEDDFKNCEYKELSSSESSYRSAMDWNLDNEHSIITSNNVAHESVHGDFWSESFESYNLNSNSQCENSCVSEDIGVNLYDPCLEYFDYGMDLFS